MRFETHFEVWDAFGDVHERDARAHILLIGDYDGFLNLRGTFL